MRVFIANQNQVRANFSLSEFAECLSDQQKEKVVRYKNLSASWNFAIGRKLLLHGLRKYGMEEEFHKIKYSENGKPTLNGIQFNITHSSNWVVCCFSKNKIGIDLEEIKSIKFEDFHFFFTQSEWDIIKGNNTSLHTFYKMWTKKESFIKTFGLRLKDLENLEFNLKRKNFSFQNSTAFFKHFKLDNSFQGTVCSVFPIKNLKFEIINFKKTQSRSQ